MGHSGECTLDRYVVLVYSITGAAIEEIQKLTGKINHSYSEHDGFSYARRVGPVTYTVIYPFQATRHFALLVHYKFSQMSEEEWSKTYRACFSDEDNFNVGLC